MHTPPRLRGGLTARLAALAAGLFLFAAGVVAFLESRLGLSPWDALHQGIARHTPLSFGTANIVVSVCVLLVAWALGARIGVGTVANAVLIGAFIELLTAVDAVDDLSGSPLGARIGLLAAGLVLVGIGSALYLGAYLGAGPRDSLMVVGGKRTGLRLGVVRAGLELSALAAGYALGGTVGVGTLVFALGVGPALEVGFWALRRSALGLPGAAGAPIPAPARPARS